MRQNRLSPPPMNLKRGALTAAVLLITTVAMASSYGVGGASPGEPEPPITPYVSPPNPLRPTQGTGQAVLLNAQLDRTKLMQNGDGTVRMQLTLTGEERSNDAPAMPSDVIVVLDRSGSMTGEKWQQARAATQELIDQLGTNDRFSLVTYESGVRLEIPLARADRENRQRWRSIVSSLETAGGTNMSAGLDTAHRHLLERREANRSARMILISDGQANDGDSSVGGLSARARNAATSEYVLSTVGVGLGFNEELMTALANVGTGNFYFVRENVALAGVFKDEFESARTTVASGLAVRLTPPAGVRVEDAAGYVLERHNNEVVFRPGTLFAGQKRTIWVRYRVPTHAQSSAPVLGGVRADYSDRGTRKHTILENLPQLALVTQEDDFYKGINKDVWGEGVAVDQFNEVRLKVSTAIQRGDREEAERELRTYRSKSRAMNKRLGSAAVDKSIAASSALEDDIAEAFTAPQSSARRNEMSKQLKSSGFDGRRGGAKK
ncbi:MAG: VWA domain-containing protein [Myxococcota bacterium]